MIRGTDNATIPVAEAISHAIHVLFANHYGKAPVDVETFFHKNLVVCHLHGTLTPGETRKAVSDPAAVAELRAQLHGRLAPHAVEAVERITGRSVVSHLAAADPGADEAIEVFVLDAPARARDVPL